LWSYRVFQSIAVRKRMPESKSSDPKVLDLAIVGGGIAGLYVAWRAAKSEALRSRMGRGLSIELFEATPRIGGRLLSVKMPGVDFHAELGGMRYTSNHILFRRTINDLQLQSKPFNVTDRLMYLRGKHLRVGSIITDVCGTCHSKPGMPYRLDEGEPMNPVQLTRMAISAALRSVHFDLSSLSREKEQTKHEIALTAATLAGLSEDGASLSKSILSSRQWRLLKQYGMIQQRPLHKLGFWNLLQHFLSSEAFLLVHDGLGYESLFANWNAAEAIPCFLADFGVDYFTVRRGLGAVPDRLAARLTKDFGVAQNKQHRLRSVELETVESDSGAHPRFRLEFEVDEGEADTDVLSSNRADKARPPRVVLADRLILALPRVALLKVCRDLRGSGSLVDDDLRNFQKQAAEFHKLVAQSVTGHALFKLFLAYDSPWWRDPRALGADSGRSTTDLPIRQVYYYRPAHATRLEKDSSKDKTPPEVRNPSTGKNPSERKIVAMQAFRGVVMASYSDEHYVDFWKPMVRKPPKPGEPALPVYRRDCDEFHEKIEEPVLEAWGITEPMLMKAHRQIVSLHPDLAALAEIPKPYVGIAQDWSGTPFYGGWHSWNPHARSWEVVPKLTQPLGEKVPLFTCGEAFSTEQGWVEGALKSAELVLEKLGVEELSFGDDDLFPVRSESFRQYIHDGEEQKD
jgi:lysine 2-monooxygenase